MSQKPIHRAFRKYGVHKFTIKEIDECDENLLNEREEYWIKYYNTFESSEGYNATSGGDNTILSEETKNKISEKMMEVKRTNIWNQNIKQSLERRAKIEPWGCLTDDNRGNGKHSGLKIQGTNITTGEIKQWDTVRDAAYDITGDANKNSNILVCARKGYKCYGYKWKILEEKSKKKAVFSIHKKTESFGPRYDSISSACKDLGDGGRGSGIVKSLRNPGKYSWKGYYWYYA